MKEALANYINDIRNPIYNFELGLAYEKEKQLSAAIGLYIRTAEYGSDPLLSYESFLRIAICFEIIGRRTHTLKGILLRAITIMPNRPEAYFLLSRVYETNKDWHESYAWAIVGDKIAKENPVTEPLKTDVQYPGEYGFIYERAVVSWWIGLYYESLNLFNYLKGIIPMHPAHIESVDRNISVVTDMLKRNGKYDESKIETKAF